MSSLHRILQYHASDNLTLIADKKKLLLEAKFADIAQEGGHRKIKKVLEKKQKKISQKEKKKRPFAPGSGGQSHRPPPGRMSRGEGSNSRPFKRQRFG